MNLKLDNFDNEDNDFWNFMEEDATVPNTKDGRYYNTSYNSNLDIYTGISRFNDTDEIISEFKAALAENETYALANLLYILDIRNGKGERLLFKTMFKYLCKKEKDLALRILPHISELGRWDYILEGLDTLIDEEVVSLIKTQLEKDKISDTPSLLAKWLPSHRTHNTNNKIAKKLIKKLGLSEKEYRQTLSSIRKKLRLIENNLTFRDYDSINFETVPTKAMLKYKKAFSRNCEKAYNDYLSQVESGEKKINTTGLYCYEIVKNIALNLPVDEKLFDLMWKNQKDFLNGYEKNILVIADTSGSMTSYGCIPFGAAVGLAIYISERNKGIFKNHFITFSDNPYLHTVMGKNIVDKVKNVAVEVGRTDIDKVFKLIITTAKENKISQDEIPSHIIIISDMEFDSGTYSEGGTNLAGWRKAFEEAGYEMPKIIFWNVACNIQGLPATKHDNDVIMVSGFSPVLLDKLLDLDNFSPVDAMLKSLEKYIQMLEVDNK